MKPRVFVASSIEAKKAAEQVKGAIREWADCEIWTDGFFVPGNMTVETIERGLRRYDGGLFLLSPDDLLFSRDEVGHFPRGNVLYELGMFGGALGMANCLQLVLKAGSAGWDPAMGASIAVPKPYSISPPREPWKMRSSGAPISDLEGITWVGLDAEMTIVGSRRAFHLTADGVRGLQRHMQRAEGKLRRRWGRTIGGGDGEMRCVWIEGSVRHEQPVKIAVFGDRLRGRYKWKEDNRHYEVCARLQGGRLVTGHWWDPAQVGYEGLAQFQLRHRPQYLLGKWLGWSSNGGVKAGNYLIAEKRVLAEAEKDAKRVWHAHESGDPAKPRISRRRGAPRP